MGHWVALKLTTVAARLLIAGAVILAIGLLVSGPVGVAMAGLFALGCWQLWISGRTLIERHRRGEPALTRPSMVEVRHWLRVNARGILLRVAVLCIALLIAGIMAEALGMVLAITLLILGAWQLWVQGQETVGRLRGARARAGTRQ